MFSAEHSFCVSQTVKTLFEDPSQNTPLQTKSAILGFSVCPLKPLFLWCLVILHGHKKWHVPKTDSVNEKALFRLRKKQIVFAMFLPKALLDKKHFVPNFLGPFESVPFPCFHLFAFSFSNIKRQKQHMFFLKTLFDTSTTYKKNIVASLHSICDFKKVPKTKENWGTTNKQILDQFLTFNLDQF